MRGFRGMVGTALIGNALAQFDNAVKNLDDGISHCKADVEQHEISISETNQKISDLKGHISKAERVKDRIKALVE